MKVGTARGIVADLLAAGGIGCVLAGTWWIWPPLAVTLLGLVALAASVLVVWWPGKKQSKETRR